MYRERGLKYQIYEVYQQITVVYDLTRTYDCGQDYKVAFSKSSKILRMIEKNGYPGTFVVV